MSNSSLVNKYVPAYSGNYTYGRWDNPINKIVIHHAAGTNLDSIGQTFQTVGRNGSAHYGLKNSLIHQYIDEANTAWHCGNWQGNLNSVGIEVANEYFNGNWNDISANNFTISEESFNTLVKLVADIAKRNNLGKLVYGVNLFGHKDMAPGTTSCPLNLYPRLQELCDEANIINNVTSQIKLKDIDNKKVKLKVDANLWSLDFITYSEAKSVKQFNKGDIIEVSAVAEHPIGSKYYLTEYSYSKGIMNGFNVVDCEDYIEPVVEEPVVDTPIENESEQPQEPSKEDGQANTPTDTETTDSGTNNEEKKHNTIIDIVFFILKTLAKLLKGGK